MYDITGRSFRRSYEFLTFFLLPKNEKKKTPRNEITSRNHDGSPKGVSGVPHPNKKYDSATEYTIDLTYSRNVFLIVTSESSRNNRAARTTPVLCGETVTRRRERGKFGRSSVNSSRGKNVRGVRECRNHRVTTPACLITKSIRLCK